MMDIALYYTISEERTLTFILDLVIHTKGTIREISIIETTIDTMPDSIDTIITMVENIGKTIVTITAVGISGETIATITVVETSGRTIGTSATMIDGTTDVPAEIAMDEITTGANG
ncbi:MAG: hypothetical protein ACQ9MH_02565 [Nitrospinales bacterium]